MSPTSARSRATIGLPASLVSKAAIRRAISHLEHFRHAPAGVLCRCFGPGLGVDDYGLATPFIAHFHEGAHGESDQMRVGGNLVDPVKRDRLAVRRPCARAQHAIGDGSEADGG